MDEAIKIVCARHAHQCLWIPQTSDHERLRVAFSTTSNFEDENLPVALFAGPMFGTRYFAIEMSHLAKTMGVRVICVDRPGMAGSDPIPLNLRIRVWLETVPLLLEKLRVKHVTLMSHSAGTIYALNTLDKLRSILHPERPCVNLIGPFVDSEESKATLMKIVQMIPDGALDSWDTVARFMITRVDPMAAWSGGILNSISSLFQSQLPVKDDMTPGEKLGVSEEVAKEAQKLSLSYLLAEGMRGSNDEARLCRKKNENASWEACENLEEFVSTLSSKEKERISHDTTTQKLMVRAFFGETDVMIGEGGRTYLDKCWEQDGVSDSIDYESFVLAGTNHDTSLLDFKRGALPKVFKEMKESQT